MKKFFLIPLISLLFTFSSCTVLSGKAQSKMLIGTWKGDWENGYGVTGYRVIDILEDGEFSMWFYQDDGSLFHELRGLWEMPDEKTVYFRLQDGAYLEYRFTNGALTSWDEMGEEETIIYKKTEGVLHVKRREKQQ